MVQPQPEEAIEGVKRRLDSKGGKISEKPRSFMHAKQHAEVADNWDSLEDVQVPISMPKRRKKKSYSIVKIFFIISVIFFVGAGSYAGITFYRDKNVVSSNKIDLEISAKSFADAGEDLGLSIRVRNNNNTPLEASNILLMYPTSNSNDPADVMRHNELLGTIAPGEERIVEFDIRLFGEQGAQRTISSTLHYRIPNSNAILEKENFHVTTIRSTPVGVSIDAQDEIVVNQEISFSVDVASESDLAGPLLLSLDYPAGFEFVSADPTPTIGNNIWNLGSLSANSVDSFTITGVARGEEGEVRTIKALVGQQHERRPKEIATLFNSAEHLISIVQPFIQANIEISGDQDNIHAVQSGANFSGRINWRNTLTVPISNVEITAAFSGNAFDRTRLNSQGFFSSATNEVVWSKDTNRELAFLEPGSSGSLPFSLELHPRLSNGQIVTNPEISIVLSIRGADSSNFVRTAEKTASTTIIADSDINVTSQTLHYSGPLSNSGPMPPQVEARTTYTLSMAVTNPANDVSRARVSTILPRYVTWLGETAPVGSAISYNPVSREVLWEVGDVEAGAGFNRSSKEVFFKVEIEPSLSQLSDIPALTGDITISGTDAFTGRPVSRSQAGLTTQLLNDTSDIGAEGRVVQ